MLTAWPRIFEWARAQLLATPGKPPQVGEKIFHTRAQQGTATPYVVISQATSVDVMTVNGVRIFARQDFDVKIIDKPAFFATSVQAMDWFMAALHLQKGTVQDAEIASCLHWLDFEFLDDDAGLQVMGSTYRAEVLA